MSAALGLCVQLLFGTTQALVDGATLCPAPVDVERELTGMLGTLAGLHETVRLLPGPGDGVVVEVRNAGGETLVMRQIDADVACADRARVAAVVVAVMLNEVHPEMVIAWPVMKAPTTPTPPPLPPVVVIDGPPPPPAASGFHFDVGAGLSATMAQGDPVLGAQVQLNLLPSSSGLGAHLDLALDMERTTDLPGGGFVDWRRIPLALGPAWRVAMGDWNLDARATLVGAWLRASGRDLSAFAVATEDNAFSLGFGGGLRFGTRAGPLTKWVDLAAGFGPSQSAGLGATDPENVAISRFSLALTLGASWCPGC